MGSTKSHRVFDSINSTTYAKFESKFPNAELNKWVKQLIRDIIEEKKIDVDFYEYKSKNQEIEILKLQNQLLNEKLDKMREKVPPLSAAQVALGDKDG